MDISVNKVNFSGKKEVLYNLKMAAKEARNAEHYRSLIQCPRSLDRSAEERASKRLVNAYMNTAIVDDSFENTIREYEGDELKGILRPEKWQYIEANPLQIFRKSMVETMNRCNKIVDKSVISSFFLKIGEK